MTRLKLALAAAAGSAALLAGAFTFQLMGYAPCHLCWLQRYPHMAAVAVGVLVLIFGPTPILLLLGALAALATAGLGVFHAGVEQKWWEGPNTCTSGDITQVSPDALLDQIMAAPLIRCDEIAWSLMGISMAGWNAILSFLLALLWLKALRRA